MLTKIILKITQGKRSVKNCKEQLWTKTGRLCYKKTKQHKKVKKYILKRQRKLYINGWKNEIKFIKKIHKEC